MLTWQADDGHGLEGVRMVQASGGFRALGRLVRTDFTASYRLVVASDGTLSRLSVTSATGERERHLTLNRTDDGIWLLDTGTGGGETRGDFAAAVDVDLAFSPLFNTLPIRRLGVHREAGEHTMAMVFVSLPELEPRLIEITYRTVRALDPATGTATVGLKRGDFSAELEVNADAMVTKYPGVSHLLP